MASNDKFPPNDLVPVFDVPRNSGLHYVGIILRKRIGFSFSHPDKYSYYGVKVG